jgi:CubicO group peptidase (beta-lactamase class C family)
MTYSKKWLVVGAVMSLACGDGGGGRADAGPADASTDDALAPDGGELDLAALVRDVLARSGAPAVGVAIVDRDGVVDGAAGGVRRVGDPTPATFDDRFHLGSNTKAMTATVAAMLVDDGRLAWDSTIESVFGDDMEIHPDFASVTLEDLLSHTAGIDDVAVVGRIGDLPEDLVAARRAGTEQVVGAPPDAPRGS